MFPVVEHKKYANYDAQTNKHFHLSSIIFIITFCFVCLFYAILATEKTAVINCRILFLVYLTALAITVNN